MAYIVDTSVIAEFLKKDPNPHVMDWAHDHGEDIYLTTVTISELQYGILRLPEGKRKDSLARAIRAISAECSQRIFGFDGFSAELCAELCCKAQTAGFVPRASDCMVAAICQRNGATLATHNVEDFEPYGIDLIDPWNYESPTVQMLKQRELKDTGQMTLELPS